MTPHRQSASGASLPRGLEAATTRLRQLEEANQELLEALAETHGTATTRITGASSHRDTPGRQGTKLIGPC